MKCREAAAILQPLQDEFARRYYRWALRQSQREMEEDFPLARRVRSSVAFLFLEFIEGRNREDIRSLMTGGVKRWNARGAELSGDAATDRELAMQQEFIGYFRKEIVMHGQPMSSARNSARETRLRELEFSGKTSLTLDRNKFRTELKKALQPALGEPERDLKSGLSYSQPMGDWFLVSTFDLSGKSQLTYGQRLSARKTIDTCGTDLAGEVSLMNWCGIHRGTSFDLMQRDEIGDVAAAVSEMCGRFMEDVLDLADGLHHRIPETIEDAIVTELWRR